MKALVAPASLPWLIWNDIRIKARGREGRWGRIIAIGVLALLPVLGGIAAAWHVRAAPMIPEPALGKLSAAMAGLLLVMISSAFAHVLRMGRDRGELELLLSAPIPAARVIAARISGVQAVVALPFLLLTLPFFLASALFGHGAWLAGPFVVAAVAVTATAIALLLATGLERLFGVARARVAAQLAGVLLAGGVFALGQTPNFAPVWFEARMRALDAAPASPLDWPARALLGDPLPLLAVLALAAGAAMVSARFAAARIEAAPAGPAVEKPTRAAYFGGSPFTVMFGKEMKLLGRDPELISQIGQQLVFMVPVLALIFTDGNITPQRMAAAGVFLGGALASSLAWLVISAEDAPDLIAAAPVPAGQVLRAKLAAALSPPMLLVLALACAVSTRDGLAAWLMLPMAALAGVSAAAMQLWTRAPAKRSAFRQRYKSSLLTALGEFLLLGCFAGTTRLLLVPSWWALAPLGVAALLMGGVWLFRPRPQP
ncbi:hypothetical protein [Sandarakinorhabdus sp.]|uniref:hypothetical protein n=1 Tax=Sandarakinorhabdus sp. TaxID=1916663 RepID=UPI003F6ED823